MPHFSIERAAEIAGLHGYHPDWSAENICDSFASKGLHPPSVNGVKAVIRRYGEGLRGKALIGRFKSKKGMSMAALMVLKQVVTDEPCLYLDEMKQHILSCCFEEYSNSQIAYALRDRLGLTRKIVQTYAKQREAAARMSWMQTISQPWFDGTKVVFIDESHMNPHIQRVWGWSARGEPCSVAQHLGAGSFSYLAACNWEGMIVEACQLLDTKDCGVDGARFLAWFEHVLLPVLGNFAKGETNSLLVLDNVSFGFFSPPLYIYIYIHTYITD